MPFSTRITLTVNFRTPLCEQTAMSPSSAPEPNSSTTRMITVYAASSANVDQTYIRDAFQLGQLIAQEGWVQLNGGGYTGLMGAATRGGLEAGGIVDAVILDKFVDTNLSTGFRKLKVTKSMPDRKAGLSEEADAFIALPGGLGTLDEIAEVMCMRQLSFHERPIALVNTNGFYDHLKKFIQSSIEAKFVAEAVSQAVFFADTPKDAIHFIKACTKPVLIDKDALHSGEMVAASKHAIDKGH